MIDRKLKLKRGSITVLAVLIMGVVMSSSLYLIYLTKLQSHIAVSSIDKIQSYHYAESKINKIIYDDKYFDTYIYPYVKEKLQNVRVDNLKVNLESCDLEVDDMDSLVICKFTDYDSPDYTYRNIVIETNASYKGIDISLRATGPIVNELFEGSIPILRADSDPDVNEIMEVFSKEISKIDIPSGTNYYSIKTFDRDKFIINNDKYIKVFLNNCEIKSEKLKDRNFLILQNTSIFRPISFEIGESADKLISAEGLIYVDGDIIIKSKLNFRGIMIVNGNISIDPNLVKDSYFRGILLLNGTINDGSFIKYDRSYIYRYGVYLPDFIKPRIKVLKRI